MNVLCSDYDYEFDISEEALRKAVRFMALLPIFGDISATVSFPVEVHIAKKGEDEWRSITAGLVVGYNDAYISAVIDGQHVESRLIGTRKMLEVALAMLREALQ